MCFRMLLLVLIMLFAGFPAAAQDVAGLADCTVKVFTEINRTHKWSGKAPGGCKARIAVEKRTDGVFVTAWAIENAGEGWVRTAFSGAMGYTEIADKKELTRAGRDIMARARHLGRCLDSINSVNDPLDCLDRATKSYLAGEESGIENDRLIWLDDNGRHTVVEFVYGNTSATPSPPADLFSGQPLPPNMIIDLHIRR
jgi:hypothetical protein